jgi:hypothetical protein
MKEDEGPPEHFRRKREPYSGMMLQSLYWALRVAIVVVVVLGLLVMFEPLL